MTEPSQGAAAIDATGSTYPMSIVVTEPIDGAALSELASHLTVVRYPQAWSDRTLLLAVVRDAAGLVVRNMTVVDPELLAAAPQLKAVGRIGAGLDNIDLDACRERRVAVFNAPGVNAASVADMTMLLLLALLRRLPHVLAAEPSWDRWSCTGSELEGHNLGLIGFGSIGRHVARRAAGFGMEVRAADPYLEASAAENPVVPLEQLLSWADVISLHVPLLPETRHLVDRHFLGLMRPGAVLINTSRGGVLDESALMEALVDGRLAGAALDVREHEPPGHDVALRQHPNVILTPHIAGLTDEAHERVLSHVCEQLREHLQQAPHGNR